MRLDHKAHTSMRWYIDANATERIKKIKDFDIQVIVHCDDEGKAEIKGFWQLQRRDMGKNT